MRTGHAVRTTRVCRSRMTSKLSMMHADSQVESILWENVTWTPETAASSMNTSASPGIFKNAVSFIAMLTCISHECYVAYSPTNETASSYKTITSVHCAHFNRPTMAGARADFLDLDLAKVGYFFPDDKTSAVQPYETCHTGT